MTVTPAADALKLFIPLTKVDAQKRLVYGVATADQPDVTKEICDYASTKPYYEKWSAEFSKNTDGKSLGALRVMHGNVAAGKLTDIVFNDEKKQIEICAKVVDDVEWNKVQEGVYTGFSQGGKYLKRWKDGDFTRYTAEPVEVSLVDAPCLPSATFSIVKEDGATEMRKFKGMDTTAQAVLFKATRALDDTIEQAMLHANADDRHAVFKSGARAFKETCEAGDVPHDVISARLTKSFEAAGSGDVAVAVLTPHLAPATALKVETPNDNEVGEQVWVNDRLPGKTFKKKADLRQAIVDLDAETAAKKQAEPVLEALAGIKNLLEKQNGGDAAKPNEPVAKVEPAGDGKLDKKDYSTDDRTAMAKDGRALKDGSFPIVDKDDLKNAISAFGRAKNPAATKRHIIKRAKALKATDMLPADWPGSTKDKEASKVAGDGALTKAASLWSISDLLQMLDGVARAEDCAELPSWGFGSAVELPKDLCDRFGSALVELGDIAAEMLDAVLSSMREEEAHEAINRATVLIDLAKLAGDRKRLAKAGAKHSQADKDKIQKAHDLLVDLDPDCCPDEMDDGDAEKIVKTLTAERDADRKAFGKQLDDIMGMVKAIAAQPLPMGTSSVTLQVVDKKHDFGKVADELIGGMPGDDGLQRLADAAQLAARRR